MTDTGEAQLTLVDGRDALAYVIIKPNATGDGVLIDAAANGITKQQAAYVLRHVAEQWDPRHDAEAELAAERTASNALRRQLDAGRAEFADRLRGENARRVADWGPGRWLTTLRVIAFTVETYPAELGEDWLVEASGLAGRLKGAVDTERLTRALTTEQPTDDH